MRRCFQGRMQINNFFQGGKISFILIVNYREAEFWTDIVFMFIVPQVSKDQLSTVNMECSTTLRSGCLEARSLFGVDLAITKMDDLDKPLISGMVMAFYVTSQSRVNEAGIAEQLKFSSESLNLVGEEFFELSAQLSREFYFLFYYGIFSSLKLMIP